MTRRLVKDVLINFPIYRQQGYFTVTLVENGIKNANQAKPMVGYEDVSPVLTTALVSPW